MFDSMTGYYDFEDLAKKAVETPTFENLQNLADWLGRFDNAWNGEEFGFDYGGKEYTLRPTEYKFDEDGDAEVTEWELS